MPSYQPISPEQQQPLPLPSSTAATAIVEVAAVVSQDGVDMCDYGIGHGMDEKIQCGSHIESLIELSCSDQSFDQLTLLKKALRLFFCFVWGAKESEGSRQWA